MSLASVPVQDILEPAAEMGEYSTVADAARAAKEVGHVFQRVGERWFAIPTIELAGRPASRRLVDVRRHEVRPVTIDDRVSASDVEARSDDFPVTSRMELAGGISRGAFFRYVKARAANAQLRNDLAELAHDLNNGLTFLTAVLIEPHEAQKHAEVASEHLQGLVARLQGLATGEPARPESIPLATVIPRLASTFSTGLLLRVTVESPPGLRVRADRVALERVLVNLLKNACEANATHVEIRARSVADSVVVDIEDDGCGLPRELASSITQRGVSTRGGVRGIGLTACVSVLRRMAGRLTILDVTGRRGTTIRIRLPAAP